MTAYTPDPELDLVLERTLPVAPDRVWAAWTDPALLVQWFTPAPWKTVSADLDVRPGGRCITTMESPEGEQFTNVGCYLQVEPGSLLVMSYATQLHLDHGIPKTKAPVGPRISIVFRERPALFRDRYASYAARQGRAR